MNSANETARPIGYSIRILRKVLVYGAGVYISVLLVLLVLENSLVYPGSKYPRGNWTPTEFAFEEVTYAAADGTQLVSWLLEPTVTSQQVGPRADEQNVVLLFHGNAENVAQSARRMGVPLRDCLNATVLVAEYRGYGKSEGTPHQAGLLQDAEAAIKWLMERTGKVAQDIIVVGHSLGGGPACYIAANYHCRVLILDRTYDSLAAAAQWNYPVFPVKLLMRNQFPSDKWIQQFNGPVFISHGDQDRLIPVRCAERLHDLAPSEKKKLFLIEDWGHWDAFPKNYWVELANFCEIE
jgi:fermentation-respiration switch protein FrsA (DUF1100 family)